MTLKWTNIDLRERLIRFHGKGKKVRLVPLATATGKAVNGVPHTGDHVLMRYYAKA